MAPQRGQQYEVTPELHDWLKVYEQESERSANDHCDRFYISRPVAYRAIAPTGSIGILAGTTTGIEPLFAVAYKRRFLTEGTKWKYQFVVDPTAQDLINRYSVKPENITSALDLANNYEAESNSRTYKITLTCRSAAPLTSSWGSEANCEARLGEFVSTLAHYAPRLRGFTCYPDGSRGGQPLTSVPYEEAIKHKDAVYDEIVDICDITGRRELWCMKITYRNRENETITRHITIGQK